MCILFVLPKTNLHRYGTCILVLFYMIHHFKQLNYRCVIIFTKKCDDNEQYLKSNSIEKWQTEAEQARTTTKVKGKIRCHGGMGIFC